MSAYGIEGAEGLVSTWCKQLLFMCEVKDMYLRTYICIHYVSHVHIMCVQNVHTYYT